MHNQHPTRLFPPPTTREISVPLPQWSSYRSHSAVWELPDSRLFCALFRESFRLMELPLHSPLPLPYLQPPPKRPTLKKVVMSRTSKRSPLSSAHRPTSSSISGKRRIFRSRSDNTSTANARSSRTPSSLVIPMHRRSHFQRWQRSWREIQRLRIRCSRSLDLWWINCDTLKPLRQDSTGHIFRNRGHWLGRRARRSAQLLMRSMRPVSIKLSYTSVLS